MQVVGEEKLTKEKESNLADTGSCRVLQWEEWLAPRLGSVESGMCDGLVIST